ncbi:MAG: hypothetical protein AAB215_03215 [Planctomycetota bacterium]
MKTRGTDISTVFRAVAGTPSVPRAIVMVVCAAAFLATGRLASAGNTWDGDGPGNNWTTGLNWNDNNPPANDGTAAITFPAGKTTAPAGATVNVDSAQSLSSLTINDLFTLTNNALTLQSGAITVNVPSSGTIAISNNVVLGANGTWTIWGGAGDAALLVNGVVSDGGQGYTLTKDGIRDLDLTANNTYTGPTIFKSGAAQMLYLRGTNATSGFSINAGTAYILGANNSVTGTVLGGAVIIGQTNSLGTGPVTFAGGSLGVVSNNMTLTNPVIVKGDLKFSLGPPEVSTLELTDDLVLDTNRSIGVSSGYGSSVAKLSGVISDAGNNYALTVNTIRNATLAGNNTYSGGTIIKEAYRLMLGHPNAVGTGPVTILGDTNASAAIRVGLAVNQDTTLTNVIIMDDFTFVGSAGVLTITNQIPLMGPVTNYVIQNNSGALLDLAGNITESVVPTDLKITGGNSVTRLGGSNTIGGGVTFGPQNTYLDTIYGLYLGNNNALGRGTLTLKGIDIIGRYVGIRADPGPVTITNNVFLDDSMFTIAIGTGFDIRLGGNGQALTLGGRFLGSASNNPTGKNQVSVKSNATLAATGVMDAKVTIEAGAALSAGIGPGSLTVNSNLAFNAVNARFVLDLNGRVAGSKYDQLVVTNGGVTLNSATVTNNPIVGFIDADDRLFIVVNDGADPISGTFNGLAQGGTVSLGVCQGRLASCKISYVGDSGSSSTNGGNDIVLYDFIGAGVRGAVFVVH